MSQDRAEKKPKGRPAIAPELRRIKHLPVMVSEVEHEAIRQAAQSVGATISSFCHRAILNALGATKPEAKTKGTRLAKKKP
jgi:actin-like ATPase involved in cell morphogenesis